MTKLIRVVGWKRIELNKLFKFSEISETNFESIFRRFVLIKIKARFHPQVYLSKHLGEKNIRNMEFSHVITLRLTLSQATLGLRVVCCFNKHLLMGKPPMISVK